MAKYMVLAPLVQLKIRDALGAQVFRHFYAGAVLDDEQLDIDEANLKSHVDGGLVVAEGERVAEVFAVPAGTPTPGQPPNVPVGETGAAATTAQPVPPLSVELLQAAELDATGDEPYAAGSTDVDESELSSADRLPRKNASEAAWREYHVARLRAQGVPEDEAKASAEGMSRDDLRAQYAE